MISKKFTVISAEGLHLRTAGILANELCKYDCNSEILYKGNMINAKSLLNIMAACIKCGDEIELQCDGVDEKEALKKAEELIESDFITN
ncbi:MAG: HPr family phosphocarrier protein [Candidatus Pseudoruminococcus sp.]|nr:HPr family phosphocarrier protein [Ruminococcus sp.]MDY2783684.1 HPr family phosphocarrier protein [Candidatus Pseudoruminococcus sp.]